MTYFPATLPYLTLSPYLLDICLNEPPCSSSTLLPRRLCISFSFFWSLYFLLPQPGKLFPQILFADSRALLQYHVTFCEVFLAILRKISHMLYLLFSVVTEDTVRGTSELLIFTFFFFRAVSLEEELLTHSRDSENI